MQQAQVSLVAKSRTTKPMEQMEMQSGRSTADDNRIAGNLDTVYPLRNMK